MAEEIDDLPQHLEFILGVVERHARSCFLLKGWSVTIVAATFLLAVRGADPILAMASGLLPSITFWGLDAFYLRQERQYRALYDHIRTRAPSASDRFSLDARKFGVRVPSWLATFLAPPVFWFHLTVVSIVILALVFFSVKGSHGA